MRFKKRNDNQEEAKTVPGEVHHMYEDAHKRLFFKRKKECPLAGIDQSLINYKNVKLLSQFVSERGRILPRRISGLSSSNQSKISAEIKRARLLALIPFVRY